MLIHPTDSISHKHSFFTKAMQVIASGKKNLLSFFIKLFLLACIINPATTQAQEAGCISLDTLFVPANTVPPTINATPASFTCTGSYTYQWFVSTDNSHFTPVAGATGQNLSYSLPITSPLIFLRQSKCGSITMYTNRVVVIPTYTACADFGLTLTGTAGNALATIKADTIKSTIGNHQVGEYVIEWYKDVIDGSPEFVSGSAGATDTAVSVSHPFAGEPAEGGTWHPVIKYIYIDGIKYSRTYIAGVRLSPDLLHCLDPIIVIVNNLNCANGGTVTSAYSSTPYAHKITYINGLNSPTLAARSFKFDLDATNKYFAWWFTGYQERDKMKITYVSPANSTSTVIEWWEVGTGTGAGTNFTTSPKIMQATFLSKINSLVSFTFSAGDYLLIEITPSANANTNWEFLCKCFTTVDCDIWDGTQRNIAPGSVTMVYDPANCSYNVTYNKSATPYTSAQAANSTLLKYNYNFTATASGSQYGTQFDNKVTLKMENKTYGSLGVVGNYYTCNLMDSSATVTKSGPTLTVVFKSLADYNQYKNTYSSLALNPNINYDTDSTKLNHYKFYFIQITVASSCGDNANTYQYWMHYSRLPVFTDATKTMTWNFATKTNSYQPLGACDFTGQQIQSYINGCNNSTVGNISTVNTNIRSGDGLACFYATQYNVSDSQKIFRSYTAFFNEDANVCNLSAKGFTGQNSPPYQWEFSHVYDRVTITNPADPINNFKLHRLMDANGVFITNPANYIKIYEIVNGVIIP